MTLRLGPVTSEGTLTPAARDSSNRRSEANLAEHAPLDAVDRRRVTFGGRSVERDLPRTGERLEGRVRAVEPRLGEADVVRQGLDDVVAAELLREIVGRRQRVLHVVGRRLVDRRAGGDVLQHLLLTTGQGAEASRPCRGARSSGTSAQVQGQVARHVPMDPRGSGRDGFSRRAQPRRAPRLHAPVWQVREAGGLLHSPPPSLTHQPDRHFAQKWVKPGKSNESGSGRHPQDAARIVLAREAHDEVVCGAGEEAVAAQQLSSLMTATGGGTGLKGVSSLMTNSRPMRWGVEGELSSPA